MNWLDGAIEKVLGYIEKTSIFFQAESSNIAKIFFVIALGLGCIKMAFNLSDIKKEIVKLFIAVVYFFILVWAFPIGADWLQKLALSIAYDSVAGEGYTIDYEEPYGTEAGFLSYLGSIGGSVWEVSDVSNSGLRIKSDLNLRITNKETGLISINKIMKLVIITFQGMWHAVKPKGSLKEIIAAIPDAMFILIVGLIYLGLLIMSCIQYIQAVFEFTYVKSVGIFFIPTMLWDGSKFIFESLAGSLFKITVKILMISMSLYIAAFMNIEILKQMYVLSKGEFEFVRRIEFYVTILFMSILIKNLCDAAPTVAEFLTGGSPRLSYGDFAQATQSAGAAGAALAGGAAAVGSGVQALAMGVSSGINNAVESGKGAYGAEKAAGAGKGRALLSATTAAGTSLMSSVSSGAKQLTKGLVSSAKEGASNLSSIVSPSMPLSAAGAGKGGRQGSNNGRGGGGPGGSGGTETNEKGELMSRQDYIDRMMRSQDNDTCMSGLREQYQYNKETGKYSGIAGNMQNGIDSMKNYFQKGNESHKGSFIPSKELRNTVSQSENKPASPGSGGGK